jgi:signal transduction histidine kinase
VKARAHLRNRILATVTGLALVTSLVFSVYAFAFSYAVEDEFLAVPLKAEGEHQREARAATGVWVAPRDTRLTLYVDMEQLPAPILEVLREEPERVEFAAPGPSHYHLLVIEEGGSRAWLVYDAGKDLIVRSMRSKLLWFLGLTTLGLVSGALLIGYLISRRVTRRLEHLATTVANLDPERMSADWSPVVGNDEVGVVAKGLESMTGRLRAFIERERSFTRDASHELRTPLAVIRSAGDQLLHQPELSEVSRQHAALISESTERLSHTVATLLALAREQPAQGSAKVKLLPLIEQVVIDQAPRIEGKPVEVIVDVGADAQLAAPPNVARIVLANLVGNAFAHTTRGVVRIDTHGGRLRITNTIVGDAAVRESSAGEGFGFGLGIVRRLCSQFGLEFEWRVEGDTVTATLPLAGV